MRDRGGVRFLAREGLAALSRTRRGALLATLMTGVAIFSVGLVRSVGVGLEGVARRWAAESHLVVYIATGSGWEETAQAVEAEIQASGLAAGPLRRVSPPEARKRFVELYGAFAGAAEAVGDGAFPASVEVPLAPGAPGPSRTELFRRLGAMSRVEEVQYDRDWIERLGRVSNGIAWAGLGLAILLGTGAALTASGAMHLSLLSAQDEIRVLRLVGATEWVIRGPYIVAGAIVGLAGSAAAVAGLFVVLRLAEALLQREVPILPNRTLPAPSPAEAALLLAIGLVATVVGSWFASRDTTKIR